MTKFAANLSTLYPDLPFLDRIQAAADDGFDAVECQLPYAVPAEAIAARLSASGLPMVLFNAPPGGVDADSIANAWEVLGMRGLSALPGHEAEFQTGFALALQYAQVLGCPRLHVMAGMSPAGHHPEYVRQTYILNLRWAAEQAARQGVDVLIEPINGRRDMPGYLLQHQADAHAVLSAVAMPNARLQLDLYHCQIMDGDLEGHLRQAVGTGRLGHVQIAGSARRTEPDVGEVNHAYLLGLLDELSAANPGLHWSGHVGCEYKPARGAQPRGTSEGLGWLHALRSGCAQSGRATQACEAT